MVYVTLVRESSAHDDWVAYDDKNLAFNMPSGYSFSQLLGAVRMACPDRRWQYFESWEG